MDFPESLLEHACRRHGGHAAFDAIGEIHLRLVSLSGLVPRLKGLGFTFTLPENIVVEPNHGKATFAFEDGEIIFDNGAIQSSGKLHGRYRRSFNGRRKLRFWSVEDACYFFGYSLVGYLGLPFILTRMALVGHGQSGNGLSWLDAEFPAQFDSHCRRQRFWFDDTGLLRRHDYRADIIGPVCWGAHFSSAYSFDHAIPIAESRRVNLRFGRIATPVIVLRAQLEVVSVTTK